MKMNKLYSLPGDDSEPESPHEKVATVLDGIEDQIPATVGPQLRAMLKEKGYFCAFHQPTLKAAVRSCLYYGLVTPADIAACDQTISTGRTTEVSTMETSTKAAAVFGNGDNIRVKDPSERYSDHRYPAKHFKSGATVYDFDGAEVTLPSRRDEVLAGVWLKYAAARAGLPVVLENHEDDLLDEIFHTQKFNGDFGGRYCTEMDGLQVKTLLDDSTSGGIDVVPPVFDSLLITMPLLSGELFPFVDLQSISQGRRILGAAVSTPSVTWGTSEGTPITEFTTDSLLADRNSSVMVVSAAITVGRDFLQDAAADLGSYLTRLLGERLAHELDRVIANGNGTSEPEGLFTASGLVSAGAPAGGAGAAVALSDLESCYFGIAKQYRVPGMNLAWVSNDTFYRRARTLRFAVTSNWVFNQYAMGQNIADYSLLGERAAIQNDIPNSTAIFGCLKRYRMYRRLGMEASWTIEGKTLRLANEALLVVRARFAGRVMDASAFCKASQLQA